MSDATTSPAAAPALGNAPATGAPAAAPVPATAVAPRAAGDAAQQTATERAPATEAKPAETKPGVTIPTSDNLIADAKAEPAAEPSAEPAAEPDPDAEPKPAVEYTDFTLPDGFDAAAPEMQQFKDIAAAANVPQEAAQKLVDLYADIVSREIAAPYQLWVDTQKTWQAEIKADAEFGGVNLDTNLRTIASAIDAYPRAEALRTALNITGAGNNPEIFRFLAGWAKQVTERSLAPGSRPAAGATSLAERFYKNPQSQE